MKTLGFAADLRQLRTVDVSSTEVRSLEPVARLPHLVELRVVTRIVADEVEVTDAAELRESAELLEVDETQESWDCRCYGYPWLELYRGEEFVASLAVHHGVAIKWRERWRR